MATRTEAAKRIQQWQETSNFKKTHEFISSLLEEKSLIYSTADLKGLTAYEALKKQKSSKIKPFLIDLVHFTAVLQTRFLATDKHRMSLKEQNEKRTAMEVLNGLMRRNLQYTDKEWMTFFSELHNTVSLVRDCVDYYALSDFPINYAIQQIERYLKEHELSEALHTFIADMVSWQSMQNNSDFYGSDMSKARAKLQAILQTSENIPKFKLLTGEPIGETINSLIAENTMYAQDDFHRLLALVDSVKGGKPTAKFSKESTGYISAIGKESYRQFTHAMITLALETPIQTKPDYYTQSGYLHGPSRDFMKGVVWTMCIFSDSTSISLLEKLIHKANTKIPGEGPVAIALANACIVTLGAMRGKDALGALSRAKLKVKQNNTKKLIDKQLEAGAKKYGVSVDELAEMAVPDFGLQV